MRKNEGSTLGCCLFHSRKQRSRHPNGHLDFWYAERDSFNQGSARSSPRRWRSSAPHIILRVPFSQKNKNPDTRMGIWIFGTPKGTRTPDLLIRSQSLYPTELSAHMLSLERLDTITHAFKKIKSFFLKNQKFFVVFLWHTDASLTGEFGCDKIG